MKSEPVATYRLQLTADFGLSDAARLTSYLKRLGISHLYTSPVLQAAEGSLSGYDVVDPTRVSEELGGAPGLEALSEAVDTNGLGWMVDIVPNHLAISDSRNPWWRDVLENGAASRYARYFDVDWEASDEREANQVLLPVLGDHFGRVLEAGELRLRYHGDRFEIDYQGRGFPVDPSTLPPLLEAAADRAGDDRLGFIADSYVRLPRPTMSTGYAADKRHRDKAVLAELLARHCEERPEARAAIEAEVERLNGDCDGLAAFIERQNYRLALWRVAETEVGYRRFFNINDLIGLRVERAEVFRAVHQLPLEWVAEGRVDALRVDHPDGLRDPSAYFNRLREACPEAWIVVEKILEPGEALRSDWPIDGTTGYDFMNSLGGLFVDGEAEFEMTRLYEEWLGEKRPWEEVASASKREALTLLLRSELNWLASLLQGICERHRRHRDYTRRELIAVLVAIATRFPVYRTYVQLGESSVSSEDKQRIREAIQSAGEENSDLDSEFLAFFQSLLLGELEGEQEQEFAMRFQQLTGPAMAKGLEDTAFYRYHRLIALNEVGGDPGRFGVSRDAFHKASAEAAEQWPRRMLASSTHDTKRSEDVRARLSVLSEDPRKWAEACRHWREMNRSKPGAEKLDPNTEYMLYQTLVGAWPISEGRLLAFLQKAAREAKAFTHWTEPDASYEEALERFARALLEDGNFTDSLEGFVQRIRRAGWLTSLSQTLIKLTAPGVPDIYQGCELWDLSLVDPDNRRPVDFDQRERLLQEAASLDAAAVMERLEEGLPKMWLVARVLATRRERGRCFSSEGRYLALSAEGDKERHVIAYGRGDDVIVVASRWFRSLGEDWSNTRLPLPEGTWSNCLLDGREALSGQAPLGSLLGPLPVALLVRRQ